MLYYYFTTLLYYHIATLLLYYFTTLRPSTQRPGDRRARGPTCHWPGTGPSRPWLWLWRSLPRRAQPRPAVPNSPQVTDLGSVSSASGATFVVEDVQKFGVFVAHIGRVTSGVLTRGEVRV